MSGTHAPQIPRYPVPDPGVIQAAAPADGFEEVGSGRTLQADVVIVGSGPGGASAARTLAEGGMKVVVLEEGPSSSRFLPNYSNTARYHMQEGGAIVAQGSTFLPIAAGRGVGGGTLINSALCFRTPRGVLEQWVQILDDETWAPDRIIPILEEVEQIIGVSLTTEDIAGENNLIIMRGAEALGYPGGLAPRNTPGCAGCGICNFGCPVNGKASANLTFLPRATSAGALIQAETKVEQVLVENGRAIGVAGVAIHPDTLERGGPVKVLADRVILSCGAIGTPRLLWFSGIANEMGPVGEGLNVHPGSAVLGLCDHEVFLWKGATQGAFFHHPDLPAVLPHTFTAPPEVCLSCLQTIGEDLQKGLEMLPYLCGLNVMVSDTGAGRVRAYPDGRAKVDYTFHRQDLRRIRQGMIESARVLMAGGATRLTAPVHGIGFHKDPESLGKALEGKSITDYMTYSAHPMSTCKMGLDPETSVVNSSGASHRIEGLYIADASVFPSSIGVNPQLTTMTVGTVIARKILEQA
jgi:choline dehydrogenase-like flavoprotein